MNNYNNKLINKINGIEEKLNHQKFNYMNNWEKSKIKFFNRIFLLLSLCCSSVGILILFFIFNIDVVNSVTISLAMNILLFDNIYNLSLYFANKNVLHSYKLSQQLQTISQLEGYLNELYIEKDINMNNLLVNNNSNNFYLDNNTYRKDEKSRNKCLIKRR